MKKTIISIFWKKSDNPTWSPMVYLSGELEYWPFGVVDLINFCSESAAYVRIYDDSGAFVCYEYLPGVMTLFLTPSAKWPDEKHTSDDEADNLIDNLPQNYECSQLTHTYAMEINDGIITIYSDLDENLKINISTEDFKIFHKAYTHVRMTHEPMEFAVTIW
jgi:hypothetical protein